MTKQCQMCRATKLTSEFYPSQQTKDGFFSYCKPCKIEANEKSNSKRMSANRRRFLEQRRGWHIKQKYGIDIQTYKEMLNKQRGMCAICLYKPSKAERSLAVDHCHKTGKIRGLLCERCNRGIGMFLDTPKILLLAYSYLKS